MAPDFIKKYFWGDKLENLNLKNNRKYIIQTLLDRGDIPSLKWLFSKINKKEVKKELPNLRLAKKSNNFWNIYLSE